MLRPRLGNLIATTAVPRSRRPGRPFRSLHLAGLGGTILYVVAAGFFRQPGTDRVTAATEPFRWALLAGLLAAFAVGYRAVRAVPETPRVRRVVSGYAVLLAAAAAVVPAFHSTDLSVYVNLGWQQAGYGVNPYRTLLGEMPTGLTDPMFHQKWQWVPCSYGFLFALETWAACAVSGPDHAVAVALLKAVAVATMLALGAVVWAGGRAAGRPDPTGGAYLVAWNPLLLLHGVSNGHNDLQFGLGVAAAVAALSAGRWLPVFPALAAAGLVKYLSAVLVPFLVVASVRRFGWIKTAAGLAVAAGLTAACWWPYRDGFDATYFARMGDNLSAVHNSLASVAVFPFDLIVKASPDLRPHRPGFESALKAGCGVVFAAFYAVLLLKRLRRPGDAARDAVVVLLAAVLTSPKFHSWYLIMVLPLAVWLPPASRVRRAVLALGVANLLSFTFVYQAHLLNAAVMLALPLWLALRPGPAAGRGPPAAPSAA